MRAVRERVRAARAIYSAVVRRGQHVPRLTPEGRVPLLAIQGGARDCGREYAERVQREFPSYTRRLIAARAWTNWGPEIARPLERQAPFLFDLHTGICDVVGSGPAPASTAERYSSEECTSFSVAPHLTLDGGPISGQNKDTEIASAELYIVLKLSITGGPTILTLTYPGEVLGYGFWSTGASLFRNALHSRTVSSRGVDMTGFGLLALSCPSIDVVEKYARELRVRGRGNFLVTDRRGNSVSIEFNGGGLNIVYPDNGILTHANHPVGPDTSSHEHYPDEIERNQSRFRMERLAELLRVEAGRLTAQRAYMALADHARYPRSLCRHMIGGSINHSTTTSIVAEPVRGLLHVTRGNPCANWPSTYAMHLPDAGAQRASDRVGASSPKV